MTATLPVSGTFPTVGGHRGAALPLVGLGSAAAACVHFVVMPEHFREATIYGLFFAIAATMQLGFAALTLARPSRSLIRAGLAGNASVVLLWLCTRTVAIPLGPDAGTTEAVSGLDILATGFELLIVAAAIITLRRGSLVPSLRPSTWSSSAWAFVVFAATAIPITTVVWPPS
ncbi:MAG TPA: hypothetical protein VG650_13720 [Mycobacteriales bacterium]|nr:hypothetical protein [Mycobacteriales bacterium]